MPLHVLDYWPISLVNAITELHTVRCHYNTVNFLKKYSQKTPHSSPVRARYGVLWIQHLIDILPQFLQLSMQHLTVLDSVISALSLHSTACSSVVLRTDYLACDFQHSTTSPRPQQWQNISRLRHLAIPISRYTKTPCFTSQPVQLCFPIT